MAESKKRIALKPHIDQIREWVDAGKTDDWIADALGTSASSVQSFRSRNDIYRRERGNPREPASVFEGVLDHGERDGWGLWFDPSVADDPIWKEHWAQVEAVTVKVAEDSIVLEPLRVSSETPGGTPSFVPPLLADQDGTDGDGSVARAAVSSVENAPAAPAEPALGAAAEKESEREQGRVKWFDPEKGYGFLIRPTGEDLFVHHSEVVDEASALQPGGDVEYVVGRNDRGPNARSVRLLD